MKLAILLLFLSLILVSCGDECYPAKEPEMKLIFSNFATDPEFKKVYGLGGKGEIFQKQGNYQLPLSLHADSVIYIFESQEKIDTLTIFYSRAFYYDSKKCGYVAAIEADTSRKEDALTTLGSACVKFTDSSSNRINVYEITIYR